jgi:ribose/xylose/arabinose/galactoside ABC-type transport system permease subunit
MKTFSAVLELKTHAFAVREMGILLVLVGMCIALTFTTPGFAEVDNLLLVARQFSMFATMGVGMTMVILTGGIDLSVGSVLALSGCAAAKCMLWLAPYGNAHVVVFAGILAGLAAGLLCGLANGLIVSKLSIPPFIVTLGMMSIARGLVYVITRGRPVVELPDAFFFLGQGRIWIVPVPVVCMLVIAFVGAVFLARTRLGCNIYAVGGNEEAARLSGINVDKVKIVAYSLCGLLAGFAGVTTASHLSSAQPTSGLTNELDVIAAVIVGGTSLMGGSGTVLGTVIGAALMGVLRNGLILLGVSANWQLVPLGTVIIVAVVFDQLRQRRRERTQTRSRRN